MSFTTIHSKTNISDNISVEGNIKVRFLKNTKFLHIMLYIQERHAYPNYTYWTLHFDNQTRKLVFYVETK